MSRGHLMYHRLKLSVNVKTVMIVFLLHLSILERDPPLLLSSRFLPFFSP